jgi:hypothetical protein
MARTIKDIYNALNIVKASMQELHDYVLSTDYPGTIQDTAETLAIDVKSNSKVAVWRLWLWIMAVGSWIVEMLFDTHKAEVIGILSTQRPHTLRWYSEQSKLFQYGYPMLWAGTFYAYGIDDAESRIIKYAAASEQNGKVILKVAKEISGVKVPLSVIEKAAFGEFWARWKDAGVQIEVVSQAADVLKVNLTIIRDRLVLDSNNYLLRDNTVNPITQAIATFGGSLEFDGILRLSKLIDAIQAAEGVIDVQLDGAWHKPAGGSYTAVDIYVESVAGYFTVNYTDSSFVYIDNINVSIVDL